MTLEQAEKVFSLFSSQWPKDAVMRVFARNRAGMTRGDTMLDPRMLANWTDYCTKQQFNAYVQMNPTGRKGTGRTSAREVTHWSWFLVDLDPISDTPDLRLAEEFVVSFIANYLGIKEPRYHLIDSGRGWQMWFPVHAAVLQEGPIDLKVVVRTEPLARDFEVTDPEYTSGQLILPLRDAASRAMSYWLNLLKERMQITLPHCGVTIDTSVSDLPRVMRLPYTWNYKTGRTTSILHETKGWNPTMGPKLIDYTPWHVWKPTEIAEYAMVEGASWHHYLTHPSMKVNARIYLTEGASEGGRHKAAAAALLSLKELGCPAAQAEAALLWGARLCSPPLEPREITPMIDRHFQRRKA